MMLCVLVCAGSYAGLDNTNITRNQGSIELPQLETRLASSSEGYLELGRLIDRLLHGRVGTQELQMLEVKDDFVTGEINALMKEFGAEEYSVPAEFVKQVDRFIRQYQERDRDLMLRALVVERNKLDQVREILRHDQMPEDFAYMAVVESGFIQASASQEGAAGFWQFTETTAREYGMQVDQAVDERLDLTKSTKAASRYIRDLILDFGTGSSVMLAMAAYNSGPEAVRRAVRNVKDPIKQRNFWYLYRTRALPTETRDYVPKVFAAIIVGRNPRQFGF
jgi:membrane-bound lytic murein transglycosylase D